MPRLTRDLAFRADRARTACIPWRERGKGDDVSLREERETGSRARTRRQERTRDEGSFPASKGAQEREINQGSCRASKRARESRARVG
eukprot:351133-Chlamydomonas_euryale.AAC.10